MIGSFTSLRTGGAVTSPLASAIRTTTTAAKTVSVVAPAPAPGVDLRAPEPVRQPVIPILFTAAPSRPSQAVATPSSVPALPRTMPAPAPVVVASASPSSLPAVPSMPFSPAPSGAPAGFEAYEDVMPVAASSGGAPELERASGGGDAPALRPASTVGVKVDAPDWAWIGGAALVVGGVGLWLYRRRA
jgi:hypothetical protein